MPLIGRIASAAARGYGLFANIVQAAVDPYFNYVVALLHGDGTNGGQNNTFLDSSSNNFTITRNGNTTQGSFSPFSQTGWGNYFDGATDSLTATNNAAYDFGSGAFTIEGWAYPTTASQLAFAARGQTTGFEGWILSTTNFLATTNGSTWDITITFTNALTANAWNHVAIVRNGNVYTAYLNGVANGTTTVSGTIVSGTAALVIGRRQGQTDYSGYISNFRIVKGTAVYTAAFTPPTTPLTAITNTQLLTCQSNRFIDNSTNAFAITRNGDVSVQPFSPFNPTTAYSTSSIGGSGYFDGSGDYLATPSSTNLAFGGDWTYEFWLYPISQSSAGGLVAFSDNKDNLDYTQSTNTLSFYNGSSSTSFTGVSPTVSAWNHVAIVNSGGTVRAYVNGVQSTNTASGVTTSSARSINIVANQAGSNVTQCYISSFRVVKGSAVYTAAFTPPTAPLTAITNTQLLCNFTNGAIFDNAAVADYETVGNAQISTSVKKYGTGSMSFDGSGDYLKTNSPTADSFVFGTGDFTIEMWVYVNSLPGTDMVLYDGRPSNGAYPCIILQGSTNKFIWYANTAAQITGSTPATSTWYHLAVCRVASQTKMFVNGTQVGSTYADTTNYLGSGTRPYIGANATNGLESFNGYIDDLRITKGVGRYQYNFTPPTAEFPNIGGTVTLTADPYYEYTTLLLPGNGTNGAQNNTFLDSSTNAFTITRNGNTTQGTFSPFSQTGWGNYFDGTGDYLETPSNAAFTLGSSGDFTIECWVYLTATSGNYAAFLTTWADALSNYTNRWWVGTNADGILRWYNSAGSTGIADSVVLTLNTWFHVAVVRSGSTITLYKNGTAIGTQTTDQAYTTQGSVKMGYSGTNSGYYFGYISNARVVKGTAVYTANFTPPTTPLTAITNTSLLTCQSNRFIDNSSNAFAITRNGDVSVQAFSPFNPTAAWSAATYGGSGYFDGSGDYLSMSDAGLAIGNGDFTLECWVYCTTTPSDKSIFEGRSGGTGTTGFTLTAFTGTTVRIFSGSALITSGTINYVNTWCHIAVSRVSGTTTLYVNGISQGTTTSLGNLTDSSFLIGAGKYASPPTIDAFFTGYISNFRIVKGTAVYTANFTPPTAPLTAVSGTSLLLNYTNAGIYDATSKNDLETVGNAQISTTQSKFGGSSMYFDGTGDYLYARNNQDLNLGTGDFTCECWVYVTSWSNANPHLFAKWNDGGNGYAYKGRILSSGASLRFGTGNNGTLSTEFDFSGANLSLNTWYHIAFTRYGSSLKAFVNGVQIGSTQTTSNSLSSNSAFLVGAASDGGLDYIFGYIDDLRVTKGIARYTSNFTPPTTAFLTL